MSTKPKRLVHEVIEQILAILPEDCDLHRVATRVLRSLSYQAPEVSWTYATSRLAPAFYDAERMAPQPEWFDRVVAIWLGKEPEDPDPRQQALEDAHDEAESRCGGMR